MMKIEEIKKNIYRINFDNQYLVASTILRVQEFYESPYNNIRNKYFSFEEYMDTHAADQGKFDYLTENIGFNIPGYIFIEFFKKFKNKLLNKEKKLKKLITPIIKKNDLFYVIATVSKDKGYLNHELAHAYYHLHLDYQKYAKKLLKEFKPKLKKLKSGIIKLGYGSNVLEDEMQAYLATGCDAKYINKLRIPKKILKSFKTLFEVYNKI